MGYTGSPVGDGICLRRKRFGEGKGMTRRIESHTM